MVVWFISFKHCSLDLEHQQDLLVKLPNTSVDNIYQKISGKTTSGLNFYLKKGLTVTC